MVGNHEIKGTVHPKLKSLPSFTRPQVVPMNFFLLLNIKEDILNKMGQQTVHF